MSNFDKAFLGVPAIAGGIPNGDADDPSTYERLDRELAQVERACATGGDEIDLAVAQRRPKAL